MSTARVNSIMEAAGYTLYFVGIATVVVALIWSFVVLLRENAFLAVLCLLLPMGLPVAPMLRWPRTWRPLGVWLLGLTVYFCGVTMLSPGK